MTILNTIELTKTAPLLITVASIIGVIFTVSIVMTFYYALRSELISTISLGMLIVSLFGLIICAGLSDECTVPNGEYQYEIVIDDATPFTEVLEQYNIIEQRGDIFLVEERNDGGDY